MKITQSQQRAFIRLFTASNWKQRLSALIIVALAIWSWTNQTPSAPGAITANSTVTGEVVSVADGDTITLLDQDKKQYKLRLAYIDAPEKAMPFGQAAKQQLSELVYRQEVTAHIDEVDRYGRGVARIEKDQRDINLAQLSAGYAWHYTQYARKSQSGADFAAYEAAQAAAQQQQKGLWADANPTPPWDWRKSNR
ncbi:thermonuclease family protein [Chitinibacter bivalviorum]|uniref:Thermonuclease family protein n=1 Tax=Chitinibacter bivalviorum TaxID=2739434 RepID=A0A7H9BJ42_9NEIS|nr:thermonuclease family protein [Chitinibacter bivalviorum]QLG88392.1 thermonuclease family protein [Chitinibacter bivalviorum]